MGNGCKFVAVFRDNSHLVLRPAHSHNWIRLVRSDKAWKWPAFTLQFAGEVERHRKLLQVKMK